MRLILIAIILLLNSCNESPMHSNSNSIHLSNDKIDYALEKIKGIKIFFGHQSVGNNILAGIEDLSNNTENKVNIVKSIEMSQMSGTVFLHYPVGKNTEPISKLNDFKEIVENGIGNNVDIAFLKFCYIDFNQSTDIKLIFKKYQQTMKYLKEKYPKTTFVHFTVPLFDSSLGIKDFIKNIIGKPNTKRERNIIRNQFNDMIRKEYEEKEPIFDLAAIESTYPDGIRETFVEDGKTYYSLVPSYTNDGGHLNEIGRKLVASKLIYFLASL